MERRTPTPSSPSADDAPDPAPAITSVVVGLAFLAVYLAWAPATAGLGDSSELTLVLATRGLAHPTGYVLYTLAGHAFVSALHALGLDWAWAANAWSALGGAVAMGLLHRLVVLLLHQAKVGPQPAALMALLPAAALGLNPAWSSVTVVAEVYAWHLVWVSGAVLFAWSTCAGLRQGRDEAWRSRRVTAWSLLVGLGVSHHATSVLVALPLSLALLVAARPFRWAWLGLATVSLLPILFSWGYVFYRSTHPAPFQWQALGPGLRETWAFVSGAGYTHLLGGFDPSPEHRELLGAHVFPWLAAGLAAALLWPFLPAGHPRAIRWGIAGVVVLPTVYGFTYSVPDPAPYFLPALAAGVPLIPVVLALTEVRRLAAPLAVAAALGVGLLSWGWNAIALDRRAECERVEPILHGLWRSIPFPRGFVIWDSDLSAQLIHYQLLDGEKPGLRVLLPLLLLDDTARALFMRRHGFDPLAGVAVPGMDESLGPARSRMLELRIAEAINHATADPVILFIPHERRWQALPKRGVRP